MTLRAPLAAETPWWKDPRLWIVLVVAWLARAAFLWLMPQAVYSDDTRSWLDQWSAMQAGRNILVPPYYLPYPPLWIQCIFAMGKISVMTGLSFLTVLHVTLIAFETVVIVVSWRLAGMLAPEARRLPLFLVGISLNPVVILLVCQHGQFDTLMMLWVMPMLLAFVRFNRSGEAVDWLTGCLFLGLAILTKTVPLILAPLALHAARRLPWKTLFLGGALAFVPVVLGMSVIYVLSPQAMGNTLGFRGMAGWFGVTGILGILGDADSIRGYQLFYPFAALAAVAGLSLAFWLRWKLADSGLVLLALVLMVSVPLWGPGYSPQYIYWAIPLAVVCFPCLDVNWRRLTIGVFIVAIATYVFEYAILYSHGWFVINYVAAGQGIDLKTAKEITDPTLLGLLRFSLVWSDQAHQTFCRLPWFFALIGFFGYGIVLLRGAQRKSGAGEPAARGRK